MTDIAASSSAPLSDEEFAALADEVAERNKPKLRPARVALQVFLIVSRRRLARADRHGGLQLVPLLRVRHADQRPVRGAATSLTPQNYQDAWSVGEMGTTFRNTAFIVIPALVLHAAAVVDGGVRLYPVQLAVQHRLPRAVHRRQPDAAAGALPAAVPDLQAGAVARTSCPAARAPARCSARKVVGDPDPHRVPDRVLHVRARQLHEDDPEGARRGGLGRRCRRRPAVLPGHAAADPAGVGRARRRWSSRGCTTTSSGGRCCSTRATSARSRRRSRCSTGSTRPTST